MKVTAKLFVINLVPRTKKNNKIKRRQSSGLGVRGRVGERHKTANWFYWRNSPLERHTKRAHKNKHVATRTEGPPTLRKERKLPKKARASAANGRNCVSSGRFLLTWTLRADRLHPNVNPRAGKRAWPRFTLHSGLCPLSQAKSFAKPFEPHS